MKSWKELKWVGRKRANKKQNMLMAEEKKTWLTTAPPISYGFTNDIYSNYETLNRVKVDENEFERKRRKAQEEAEEKKRLRRLDIFDMEKLIQKKGYKRSRSVPILPLEM